MGGDTVVEEGWDFHRATLAQYESIVGSWHYSVVGLCHRVGLHHIRRGEIDLTQ